MLPPPSSRKSSYAYTLPTHAHGHNLTPSRRAGHPHASGSGRIPSFRSAAESVLGLDDHEDDEDEDEGENAGMEEEEARGLEETLERIGFGMYALRV